MNNSLVLGTTTTRPDRTPWLMLPARTVLFVAFQALFALGYLLAGFSNAWDASAAWWPFTVTFANLVCIGLLVSFFRSEGKSYLSLFRIDQEHLKNDLWIVVGLLVITVPVAMLPNLLLANWLFGNISVAMALFIRHLPGWAAYAGFFLFPISQGLAELVTYFLYIQPRLEQQIGSRWLSLSLAAVALAFQHLAVPLLFNGQFILWRMLMFIPFAFMLGIVLRWRPRLLPYLAVIHILMDMGTAFMLLTA